MKLVLASFVLSFATPAFAWEGGEVRNGGNSVVCYDSPAKKKIVSVESFDFWEGRNFRTNGAKLDLGDSQLSVEAKVKLFIDRYWNTDRRRAHRLKEYSKILLAGLSEFMVASLPAEPIDDDQPLGLPKAPCYKEQFAIQFKSPQSGARRFQIHAGIYNHPATSNDTRAGILIHEILYRDAIIADGAKDSNGVRALVWFYSSTANHFAEDTEFVRLHQTAKIALPAIAPIMVTGSLKGTIWLTPVNIDSDGKEFRIQLPAKLRGSSGSFFLDPGTAVEVARDRGRYVVKRITLKPGTRPNYIRVDGKDLHIQQSEITVEDKSTSYGRTKFVDDYKPKLLHRPCLANGGSPEHYTFGTDDQQRVMACAVGPETIKLANGIAIGFTRESNYLTFYSDGSLHHFVSEGEIALPVIGLSGKATFKAGSVIHLDLLGNVIRGSRLTVPGPKVNGVKTILNVTDFIALGGGKFSGVLFYTLEHPNGFLVDTRKSIFKFCRKYIHPNTIAATQIYLEVMNVIGEKKFFDIPSAREVTKIDEKVSFIPGLTCGLGKLESFSVKNSE